MKTLTSVVTIVLLSTVMVRGVNFAELQTAANRQDLEYFKFNVSKTKELSSASDKSIGKAILGTNFTHFEGFGSVEKAINEYAVPNIRGMVVAVYQQTPEGFIDVMDPSVRNQRFTTFAGVNDFFRQRLNEVAPGSLSNPQVNKDAEFRIFAYCVKIHGRLGQIVYLYHSSGFFLRKSEDGSYNLPNFDNLEFQLAETMVYEIPRLELCRIEWSYNPATTGMNGLIDVLDSRTDPPGGADSEINLGMSYIQVKTDLCTAGTSGNTLLKITTITPEGTNHAFKVYGPMGTQVPETQIRTSNFRVDGGNVSFKVKGGDCGRVVMVQTGITPSGPWTDVGSPRVVPPYGLDLIFSGVCNSPEFGFFRVRTVDMVPEGL